jgi:hypothetical protein
MIYIARKHKCEACALKPKCCPNVPARKIARSVHEAASVVMFKPLGQMLLVRLLIEWSQVRVLLGEPKSSPCRTKPGTPPTNKSVWTDSAHTVQISSKVQCQTVEVIADHVRVVAAV